MATYEYAKTLIVDTLASLPSSGMHGTYAHVKDTNRLYYWNGSAWSLVSTGSGGAGILDTKTSATTINTTTTETSIYSYTIPGGTLGSSDYLRLTLYNDFLNSTGAGRTITTRVKFGGSTVLDYTSSTHGSLAYRRPDSYEILVMSLGATNSQMVVMRERLEGTQQGTTTTGTGQWSGQFGAQIHSATLTNDMTSNQTIEVTVELSFSSANLEFKCYFGFLELGSV